MSASMGSQRAAMMEGHDAVDDAATEFLVGTGLGSVFARPANEGEDIAVHVLDMTSQLVRKTALAHAGRTQDGDDVRN